ncbi:MAG: lipid-A-disaccharide synthase [Epsilonproteobacteria bacterium]|nr:lipid-A-disaccharide synthase [Campylobacterota bacterium]NPA57612.1 lipid-A-disaccharide synthase [Campylobacterota bacterium]
MKLLVSAIERSANLHLEALLPYLQGWEIHGICDGRLGRSLIDLQSLAVMGFVDVVKKIPLFLDLKRRMVELAGEAEKVLLIDGSGFNLPLAKAIKERYPDKEIIYYILPQAWAWRRGRVRDVVRYVDRACSILPFEPEIYPEGYSIEYVGHPLLDEIEEFKERVDDGGPVIFMPGSRRGEVKRLMPIFREVRRFIEREAVLVIPDHLKGEGELYGDLRGFEVTHDSHGALLRGSFAFICSGTATLEASLIGTPLALVYIARPLDYLIAKSFAQIDRVGLANIMVGDLHPEFLQSEVHAFNLLRAYRQRDPLQFLERSRQLREYLGHGSAERVGRIVNGEF